VGPRTVLDAVLKREIPSPHRESNPRTPIVQPVALNAYNEKSKLNVYSGDVNFEMFKYLKTNSRLSVPKCILLGFEPAVVCMP
jgi:hypothetical protein